MVYLLTVYSFYLPLSLCHVSVRDNHFSTYGSNILRKHQISSLVETWLPILPSTTQILIPRESGLVAPESNMNNFDLLKTLSRYNFSVIWIVKPLEQTSGSKQTEVTVHRCHTQMHIKNAIKHADSYQKRNQTRRCILKTQSNTQIHIKNAIKHADAY